ncbi:PHO85 cyclin-2 [Grifola frondosa]|uniref:PHO85 cyclin-2 n=1 Tax=Grifola frondosa TaxID=5627 RepID=A0A1C7M539_GRIFR|nr:PHO85 cyclin-2 [Grifola frondosa]
MERLLRCALFVNFAKCFVEESRIDTSTILVALVYISRLQIYVPPTGDDWLCERIFLGAIILAYRCQNDTDVKPDYWASSSSGTFDTRTICRVQREFLYWINYDVSVHNDDLLAQYDIVMDRCVIDRGCWAKKTIVNITDVERPEYRCTIDPQSPPPPPHIESPPCFVPDLEYPSSPSPPSSCDSLTLVTPEGYAQTSWHPMASESPLVHQTQLAPRSYRTRDVEQTGYTRYYTQDLISASIAHVSASLPATKGPRRIIFIGTHFFAHKA